jgi:hypothetical protein
MNNAGKMKCLALLGLTLVAIGLIAAGLPRLEFLPGIPLPAWEGESVAVPSESAALPHLSVNILAMAILGVVLGSTLLYAAYRFIRGASWKQMLTSFRFAAVLILVVSAVIFLLVAVGRVQLTLAAYVPEVHPAALSLKGLPLGPLSPLVIWLVWIGLGLVMALLVFRIILWSGRDRKNRDALAAEAERALDALRSGESFRNVIVRCYSEMSLVLQKERGLALEETMTAQEFERLLEARGIPHAPIEQLTRLFEAARYGWRPPTSADEQAAIDSLNAIVLYIRGQNKVF